MQRSKYKGKRSSRWVTNYQRRCNLYIGKCRRILASRSSETITFENIEIDSYLARSAEQVGRRFPLDTASKARSF